ncbi:MAG TPA: aspartate kinase [Bacteroidia bacterium]|nr:aspartate kinase [Bacteroidia bacterium]
MNIYVHKFGGASLKDALSFINVAKIIQQLSTPSIVVVSATGKTTNALEDVVKSAYFKKDNPLKYLEQVKQNHLQIIQNLFLEFGQSKIDEVSLNINEYWVFIEKQITNNIYLPFGQFYDQIVSVGELVSSIILSEYLNSIGIYHTWVDIRKVLITDTQWRSASVNLEESEKIFQDTIYPLLSDQSIILTQGFIGGTSNGYTTTLGREGSDYTAALLANFTNAKELTIWKDVDGVLNADPRYFKNAQKIDELSYYDAIEMTYYGATVIHPKTIKPLQNKNIPLKVKSFLKPSNEGTIIHQLKDNKRITTYTYLPNQILISLQSNDYSFFTESHLQVVFQIINQFGFKLNLMQNTALNFSFCITFDEILTPSFIKELQKHFKVFYNEKVAILTIRNYVPNFIQYFTDGKEILLEQRTRHHVQFVMKEK